MERDIENTLYDCSRTFDRGSVLKPFYKSLNSNSKIRNE